MSENVEKDIESIKRTFISERSRIAKQHDLEIQKYQKQLEESEEMGQENCKLKQANETMREEIICLKEQVEKLSSQRREFERERVRNSLKRKAPESPESARKKFSSID
jgi:cell division protein FtsB